MGKTYRAVEITKPGTFHLAERSVAAPGEGQVRIRVEACGVCHSDAGTVEGQLPGVVYTTKNWRTAIKSGPAHFPRSCSYRPIPASSNCMAPASAPRSANAGAASL